MTTPSAPDPVDPADLAEPADPAELADLAELAAVAAGRLITEQRPERVDVAATKSSPTDVVTEMDRRSEALLRELLLDARPGDGLLGEEGADVPSRTGVTWVVDPIDGTVNYLYDLPGYAVSVAAVAGDPRAPGGYQVLAGAVRNPATRETYRAVRGGGAWLDGRRLRVRDLDDLGAALVGTGFGYGAQRRAVQAEVVRRLITRVRDVRRIGSAAVDLCSVAAGRLDAYYERGLHPWDLAAGELVAREAGALVTGLGSAPAGEAFVVCAPPTLHGLLQSALGPLAPDRD